MADITLQTPLLQKPSLVHAPSGSAEPTLRVLRCACGHVQFPPQPYGCERCGADGERGTPAELGTRGQLLALATVFAHPKLPTPYVLARVLLDEGVAVDARLEGEGGIGQRVCGRLVPRDDERGSSLEFVFTAERV